MSTENTASKKTVKIAVDTLGGDKSPNANIDGTIAALKKHDDLAVIMFGDSETIEKRIDELGESALKSRIEIVHSPNAVDGNDKPIDAIRLKRDSSMIQAIKQLRENGELSALVSTGATGVLVGGCILRIGRIKGVRRPAFCPILPTMNGSIVGICDSGASVECSAEQLRQNAVMASAYIKTVYGIESPRVALLNVGVEEEKGDDLRREAYALLKAEPSINFVGNMESRDLLSGKYDIVVCDGFSGNVLVKSHGGACLEMLKKLKKDISSSFINKIGALFMYKMFMKEKEFMNYQNYGGSVLLGLDKVVVKGHGSSGAHAFEICIDQAYKMVKSDFCGKMAAEIGVSDNNIKEKNEQQGDNGNV